MFVNLSTHFTRFLVQDYRSHFTKYFCYLPVAFLCAFYLTGCSHQKQTQPKGIQKLQQDLASTYPEVSLEQPNAQARSARVQVLLSTSLTPQSATQLMFLSSPHLQVELARLGVADAAREQASVLSNPRASLTALKSTQSSVWQWDLGLTQSLLELMTRSAREKDATNEWMTTQLKVTQIFQQNIQQLQQVYFAAIAAKQKLSIQENLLDAAIAKQQLAKSIFDAGNMSELDYLEHLSNKQEFDREFSHQQEQVTQTQIELHYLLGLNDSQEINLPEQLPSQPKEKFYANQLINEATQKRIDIQLAKLHQDQLNQQKILIRKEYGLADSTIGVALKKESDGTHSVGPQVELALPLFDRGQAKLAVVDAQIAAANAEMIDAQHHAVRDIKQAIAQLEHTHREQLADAQITNARRVELAQKEINFMLKSPFDLIDLKIHNIQLQQEQTSALLSYWQARSQLELALGRSIAIDSQTSISANERTPVVEKTNDTKHIIDIKKSTNETQHKGHQHD